MSNKYLAKEDGWLYGAITMEKPEVMETDIDANAYPDKGI